MTINFEGKLHGFRRTQDGVVVSYVVHPNDVSAELATAALGTRYMVAVAEIGDDEKPVSSPVAQRSEQAAYNRQAEGSNPSGTTMLSDDEKRARAQALADARSDEKKDRRPFNSLPLSQQAAIRATDEKFQEWLEGRSCILEATEEAAASYIRRWCGITSRRDIVDGDRTGSLWHELERDYKAHLTDIQYAGARR